MEKGGNPEQSQYYEEIKSAREKYIRAVITPRVSRAHEIEPKFVERIEENYARIILGGIPKNLTDFPKEERNRMLEDLAKIIVSEKVERFSAYDYELVHNGFEPEFLEPTDEDLPDDLYEALGFASDNPLSVDVYFKTLKKLCNQSIAQYLSFSELATERIVAELKDEVTQIDEAIGFQINE